VRLLAHRELRYGIDSMGQAHVFGPFLVSTFCMALLGCGSCAGATTPTEPRDASTAEGSGDASREVSCPVGSGDAATASPEEFIKAPMSCAYACPITDCAEVKTPYTCQNLGEWACIPHSPMCGAWDGTYPAVVPGKCSATAPTGKAIQYAGADPDQPGGRILPDGRRTQPAGAEWIFSEPELTGGLTTAIAPVAGTSYVLTVDTGTDDHVVRLIDTTLIGSGNPVVSYVAFVPQSTLNSGITFIAPDLVYVATDNGNVQALTIDTTAGTIALDATRTLTLPPATDGSGNWYVSGVTSSPDGTLLAVTGVTENDILVYDVGAGSPTFGKLLGQVSLGASETFAAAFDPFETSGYTVYVTMWGTQMVVEVDLSTPSAPKVTRTFATGKDPQGIAFLDATWMVVTNDLGETLSLIDRTAGTISSVPIASPHPYNGLEPSTVAFDASSSRLYATLAGFNAVAAFDVDLTKTPPTLVPAGRLGTSWWPGGVTTTADGSVIVASMQGHGSGPIDMQYGIGNSDISDLMRGGVQRIPTPSSADLTAGDTQVTANDEVGSLAGYPRITCPGGANDFPVPATNAEGPSEVIEHVFLILRENKDFDGLFGDFPDVDGDPAYVLKPRPGDMDRIWANLRQLARTFTLSDNYYTDAVYSTQGHVWATYGRTNDFNERTWAISGNGRDARSIPGGGVIPVGMPTEGSLFDWLDDNGIAYDILGEIDGSPAHPSTTHPPQDLQYPGGPFQNILYDDDEKACHIAGRARVTCDFGSFVYATVTNDHTGGVSPTNPSPETYCAVNDDATGMAIDAITHSPLWASSLIFITEDDPSQGGEHIDSHRTPLVVISPWVKRGYVSKSHIDMASLHKVLAHVFGKPYPNALVANAGLPLDMFTSTPDYTPYTYTKRTFPLVCGDASTMAEQRLTESWDWDEPDHQPGLDAQAIRWMRERQLEKLTPRLEREVEERWLRRLGARLR
jgi:hypothetical protein